MQVRAAVLLLMVLTCTSLAASVSVVRVPRVYNVLIRSDGALAQSEAVSADSVKQQQEEEAAAEEGEEEEEGQNKAMRRPELPILDPKLGAIQDNVNYTEVPLSRAYPLTRYTAPLLAPFSYLAPLHGGLILGPVPRLPTPAEHEQHHQQAQQQQQQAPRGLQLPRGAFEDADREAVAVEAEEDEERQ